MTATVPRRRALLAYAAGLTVLAGLMTVVALGGSAITSRKSVIDLTPSQVTALKQP